MLQPTKPYEIYINKFSGVWLSKELSLKLFDYEMTEIWVSEVGEFY